MMKLKLIKIKLGTEFDVRCFRRNDTKARGQTDCKMDMVPRRTETVEHIRDNGNGACVMDTVYVNPLHMEVVRVQRLSERRRALIKSAADRYAVRCNHWPAK